MNKSVEPSLDAILDQLAEAVAVRVAERLAECKPQQKAECEPDFLSEKATAKRYNISVRTLQSWRATGRGPKFVKCGRAVRYPVPELKEFFRAHSMFNELRPKEHA